MNPIIERLLADANPWWRDPSWADRDVQLARAAEAPFTYDPGVLTDLVPGGLYVLRGPRRTGKSTELKRTIERLLGDGTPPRSIVHAAVEGLRAAELEQLISHAAGLLEGSPGTGYWFVDEITAIDGPWPSVIKRMRDANRRFAEDTVVLSGSSATQLEEATKALAGRRGRAVDSDRLLLQMPFTDVARALGVGVPAIEATRPGDLVPGELTELIHSYRPFLPALIDAWDTYLRTGGYPQAVADYVRQGAVEESFDDALFDVVHGDALSRARLAPVQTLAGLRALSRSVSSLLDVSSVAVDMDVSHAAARSRLEDLRRSFLAYPVHREQGLAPKPRSQAKWYFTDPLLAGLAARRGAGSPPDASRLAEQQLALALLRALARSSPSAALHHDQLLYYRSATRSEIDFVAAEFGGVCFESRFVNRAWGRAFQTIAASPYQSGVVATRSGLRRHERGWALPASLLAVLLGA